jgi:hypothetical protein
MEQPDATDLIATPLAGLHAELGGRMVPFAGHSLPVQYPGGIIAEHNHTRAKASLFDVSHMGQVTLTGGDAVAALERLVPGNIAGLAQGRIRYTMFTTEGGGIIDDLMAANGGDHLRLVVNGTRAAVDLAHLRASLTGDVTITHHAGRALMALQGPAAASVLAGLVPAATQMLFMSFIDAEIDGIAVSISRCGYTGEDGYELSVPAEHAEAVARHLLAHPDVEPASTGPSPSAGLPKAGFPAGSALPPKPRQGPSAGSSASARKAEHRRGAAPKFSTPPATSPASSPAAASAPLSAVRSPWGTCAPTWRRRERRSACRFARPLFLRRSHRCHSFHIAITNLEKGESVP